MKRKTNGKTVPAHGISKTFTVEPLLVSGFFFLVSLWHNSSVSLLRLVSMGPSLDLRVATPITFQSHAASRGYRIEEQTQGCLIIGFIR
jgi:hypothetical protein